MKYIFLSLLLVVMGTLSVQASDVVVEQNQAKLEVNGAVCAYCAYGMQKGLSKMGYIDQSKGHKGIEADVDNQIMTIYLKENAKVNVYAISKSIRKSGYEPRAFHMRVSGVIINENGKVFLTNDLNEKLYELVGDLSEPLKRNSNVDVQLMITESSMENLKEGEVPLAEVRSMFEG